MKIRTLLIFSMLGIVVILLFFYFSKKDSQEIHQNPEVNLNSIHASGEVVPDVNLVQDKAVNFLSGFSAVLIDKRDGFLEQDVQRLCDQVQLNVKFQYFKGLILVSCDESRRKQFRDMILDDPEVKDSLDPIYNNWLAEAMDLSE